MESKGKDNTVASFFTLFLRIFAEYEADDGVIIASAIKRIFFITPSKLIPGSKWSGFSICRIFLKFWGTCYNGSMNTKPDLYIITGPSGVGKSTVSGKIAGSLSRSALIEGDDIYGQIKGGYIQPWEEGNYLSTFWKISINTMKIYLEDGFDVIFNYIVLPEQIDRIRKEFSGYTIRFIVLMVDEDTVILRDSQRPEDLQMKERSIVLLNDFRSYGYKDCHILDTSHMTIDEAVTVAMEDDRFIIDEGSGVR